jgi:uncharacterized membrane protein (DUF4010 family)
LWAALIFGGLYALVRLGVAAAKDEFGSAGMYAVAVVSGLHDMDAITLSTAQLVSAEEVEPGIGWRVILAAALSNLVFKAGIVGVLGSRRLLLWVGLLYSAAFAGGIALLFLWPS